MSATHTRLHQAKSMCLPFSHDEVVHGKSPMLYKMPGDEWQKFANVRALYTYMWTHPGGRLLFMGNEFGQTSEWNYKSELDWFLLQYDLHRGLQTCVQDLNQLLKAHPALYEYQFKVEGFEWVDLNHRDESVIVYKRSGRDKEQDLLVLLNLTPVPRYDWQVEVEGKSYSEEIFNSDAHKYGGTGTIFNPDIRQETVNAACKKYKIIVNLPPLAGIILR